MNLNESMIRLFEECSGMECGGKARGLKVLKEIGLRVPEGFVIIHPSIESIERNGIEEHIARLGNGLKAVRSSAICEDGMDASFAGQFETFLNLRSYKEIKEGIINCINAAGARRVNEYASRITGADLRISVIIQNMVDARIAGVVFSADPVTSRRDKIIVNAVEGLGEKLVSGKKDGIQYSIFRSGSNIENEILNNGSLMSPVQLQEVLTGVKKAESFYKCPVDLEWAIDNVGSLHWLQVRPVTTLDEVHYNELDTIKGESNDVWTLGNIGEMMPGVVTPLTYSVCAESIDYGMTVLADAGGAFRLKDRGERRYIQMFYNRLFINMTNMMDYAGKIWLNKKENVQFSICGKVIPELRVDHYAPVIRRIVNFIRQTYHISRAGRNLKALRRLEQRFAIDTECDLKQIHHRLTKARNVLGTGFGHHLLTSGQSGTLYAAFMGILTGDKRNPDAADHHLVTVLLSDIPEIESAEAVKSLEYFAEMIYKDPGLRNEFVHASPAKALHILRHDAPTDIATEFMNFLQKHGHRCIRETELREKPWDENPLQVIYILQAKVKSGRFRRSSHDHKSETRQVLRQISVIKRLILSLLLSTSRKAVARREISKSLSIKMVNKVRKAYQELAFKLTREELLDDKDQIYFLTHEELGILIDHKDKTLLLKANKRRKQLAETDLLLFNDVSFGIPEPIEKEAVTELKDGQLSGTPVSNGVVIGKVRIINLIEDADQLREGEIMIAAFTDIGWTPYFSMISGLITEIGSPLSHGAVVAREYRIPAIVGVKGAKHFFKTGDMVRLDGDKGVVEKITE